MQQTGQPDTSIAEHRFVVMANQPPAHGPGRAQAARLVAMLDKAGGQVITASEPHGSYGHIPLQYHTQKRLAETRQIMGEAVTQDTKLLVFASVLRTDTIDKPDFRTRLAERKRRYLLVRDAARPAHSTTFVFDTFNPFQGTFWIAAALILPLLASGKARLGLRRNPARLFQALTGNQTPDIPLEAAKDTVFALAIRGRHPPDLSSVFTYPPPAPEARDAERIAGFCQTQDVKNAVDFQHFASLVAPPARPGNEDSKRMLANTATSGILSRFVRHYRENLPGTAAPPLDTLRNDAAFLEWYIHAPFPNAATPPPPIAPDIAAEMTRKITGTGHDALAGILRIAARADSLAGLSQETLQAFAHPVAGRARNLTGLELAVAILAKYPARTRDIAENPWRADEIRHWFATVVCPVFPALQIFSSARVTKAKPSPTLKIAGIVNGQSGLARNARMSAETLVHLGFGLSLHASNALPKAGILPAPPQKRPLLRSLILHNANAHRVPGLVLARALSRGQNPLHVGYLLWELEQVPQSHRLAGELLDEIWVPSRFIQKTYEAAYGRRVHNVGKAITLPEVMAPDLSDMGIAAHHKVFVVIFDANSSVERKNPLAAVRAFLAAFPTDQNVRMLVKTTPFNPNHKGDPSGQLDAIWTLAAKDPRIVIEQAHLPFTALLGRIKRADCVVSPHRAEGFGYIPAFALKMARPVIATDYSGTRDFCTPETAFTVPYGMSAPQFTPMFRDVPDALWAEVDIHAMARQMQAVLANPEQAKNKALAGQALVNRQYAPERLEDAYLNRLIALGVVER